MPAILVWGDLAGALVAGCEGSLCTELFAPSEMSVGVIVVVISAMVVAGWRVIVDASIATPKPAAIAIITARSASTSRSSCFDTAISLLVVLQHAAG
jgi:hypothetical protein